MGRNSKSSSSSSFGSSSNHFGHSNTTTDLSLGLSINSSSSRHASPSMAFSQFREQQQQSDWAPMMPNFRQHVLAEEGEEEMEEENECNSVSTFFVKVNMQGIPIGRKIDLLAHDGYNELIRTLDYMFNTSILWAEEEGMAYEKTHVLTYEDREGDWLMVGDVPWEMFLSTVKRLKITRAYHQF